MSDIDKNIVGRANDLFSLADKYFKSGDYQNSLEYFNEYFKQNPNDAFVCNTIGYLHKKIDGDSDIDEQIKYFKKAIELQSDFVGAIRNLAFAFYRAGEYQEALKFYKKILELEPIADDYFAYACLQIMLGDFKEGWKNYEYRFLKKYGRTEYPQIEKPRWDGQDISNKTLLVHYEQGFGDSIHFFRYIKKLQPLLKKVIFRVQNEMVDLLKINSDGIEIVGVDTPIEKLAFDYHIPLMSLPLVMDESVETIPFAQGYLNADKNKVEIYKKKFFDNDCLKIGISWRGSSAGNSSRDIPLSAFYSLCNLQNMKLCVNLCVKIYSFQKSGTQQLENLLASNNENSLEIIDVAKSFNDFSDTAAAMENLDLFVTSDNSVLNLAGAMGKETFLLLNKDSEWRWFLDENNTPWYNSVKIIKKRSKDESWDLSMDRVIEIISNDYLKG